NISMLSTIAAISPPLSRSCAVSSWPFGRVLAHGLRRAPPPRRRSGPPPASPPGVTSAGVGLTLLCVGTPAGDVTDGRTGLAGGAVRGPPHSSAGGVLPDARLGERGR